MQLNIAIIGSGAIGSVVSAYLTMAGQDVVLIGRKDQIAVIGQNGLKVQGARGDETFRVKVLPRVDKSYDLVILAVKTQDIEQAVANNREFLNNTRILSAQNGVQADAILRTHFAPENVYSSIVMFGATYTLPGEVIFNFDGDWIIGKPFGPNDEGVNTIAQVLKKGFSVVVSSDITGMKWLKLFVNLNNCIPALIGKPMQEVFADMDMCRLSILLLREGLEIVRKNGIELVSLPQFPAERVCGLARMPMEQAAGIIHKTLTSLSKEPLYGSILQSIMRGRTSEIDYINGEVVRLAKNIGGEAPLNWQVVDLVHQVEKSRKYFEVEEIKKRFHLRISV